MTDTWKEFVAKEMKRNPDKKLRDVLKIASKKWRKK